MARALRTTTRLTARRTTAIGAAVRALLDHLEFCDEVRTQAGVSDLVLGNPQDMPLPGFVRAISEHGQPRNKDWFAYKRSAPDARHAVAAELQRWRGLPFEPEDIALTSGAFGAIATAFRTFLDPATR